MTGRGDSRDDDYTARSTPVKSGKVGSGGGGGDGAADPCDIAEIVPLNSPQPPVVSTLTLGQVLNVILSRTGPNPVLEVVTAGGAKAGALTHRNHVRLINCIDEGRAYQAVVVTLRGGSVEVRVELA